MNKLRVIITLLAIGFSSNLLAGTDLKPLAMSVSEAAKQIVKDAGKIKSAENPISATRDLHIQVAKLKETAAPLGNALSKPYGQCAKMVTLLDDYIDASSGMSTEKMNKFNTFRASERDCEAQITETGSKLEDKDLVILDL